MQTISDGQTRPTVSLPAEAERPDPQSVPGRLYLLDILRGLAALAVVVWHYQHFFYIAPGVLGPGFTRDAQPFYSVLFMGYEHGLRAVELFFVLSGFVFFFQYSEDIRARSVGAGKFFVHRFSRLYPLHFATLVLVALGQSASRAIDGQYVVYPCNDAFHFGLNLLLVTEWLPSGVRCFSFNAPVWSISVEVLLYALFFAFAAMLPRRWSGRVALTAIAIVLGVAIARLGGPRQLGEPVYCFFAGGLTYLIWSKLCTSRASSAAMILLATVSLVGASFYCWRNGPSNNALGIIAFPSAIMVLAALQSLRNDLGRGLRLIGDITYSTYLLHFPIQLGLILLVKSRSVNIDFTSAEAFLLFFGLIIAVSIPSYYLFERPMQRYCRQHLLPRIEAGKRS